MKYRYTFTIEDVNEETTIIKAEGWGTARSKKNCLKTARRDISSFIKEQLDHLEAFGE